MSTDEARRLLSPLTGGSEGVASDAEVTAAMIAAEVALVRAWAGAGVAPQEVANEVSLAFGWDADTGTCALGLADAGSLGESVAVHGTPVIELVSWMRSRVSEGAAPWIHRGATSQDVIDTALMEVAARAAEAAAGLLVEAEDALAALARDHRDTVAIARTLTQHAAPTTFGARVAGWLTGISRARARLEAAAAEAPAQLGGAVGTLDAFIEVARAEGAADPQGVARDVAERFAAELFLRAAAPWHTVRAPVTELGDALVQSVDAVAHFAADVSVLGRPEIGEVATADAGGSSAMPHKRNPTSVVLIRAAGVRAPFLGATLHAAAASATDERADGPWQAEWPALQELAALAYGTAQAGAALAGGLTVNAERVAANLALSAGASPELSDPDAHLGLAGEIVDEASKGARES